MADLNQVELQHLRHLIGAHETAYQKLNTYSSQAVDPQIKQIFTKTLYLKNFIKIIPTQSEI